MLLVSLLATQSSAHQQKAAISRVLFNPTTGNIEVMHRFFVHDAEHAVSLIFGQRQTLMESAESRELFSSYVMNRFAISVMLSDGSTERLPLSYVGEEIDGQFLWVYQEVPQRDGIHSLSIVNLALRDVWPDQSNMVNIEHAGKIQTLTFAGNTEQLKVDLNA
ncbi:MAG: hypothetical protein OXE78_12630 [Gammaproteobacteria bacterium]|nr:hypothetical protein [Gammaproteobacteria bacterium]MCY4357351.1 hypothetical protein [Gammaproteobacteria bacterium]